jgi:hypothetical protein
MDERDKKIKELEATLAQERVARTTEKTSFEKTIAEKDVLIQQKTDDVIGARKQYKKLSEMTEAERNEISEQDQATRAFAESLEAKQKQIEETQKQFLQKEIDARKARTFERIAGKNPELQAKVSEAYKKIVDSDKAQTDEEIAGIASMAFNMLGVPKPDPVRAVMNNMMGGEAGGAVDTQDYSATAEGKGLAGAMGLNMAKEQPKA